MVYEVHDMPTGNYLKKVVNILEKYASRNADVIILASRFFVEFYKGYNYLVLENKPPNDFINKFNSLNVKRNKNLSNIAFIGALRYPVILKNLIDAVKSINNLTLDFYGEGNCDKELKEYVNKNKIKNVNFHGRYSYENIYKLYANCDLIWAAYPSKDFNVKYAISNKYHESFAFKIPSIFAKNTKLGDFVKENNLGLTVDPYCKKEIKKLLVCLMETELLEKIKLNLIKDNECLSWEEQLKKIKDNIFHL